MLPRARICSTVLILLVLVIGPASATVIEHAGASALASSGMASAGNVTDADPASAWTSASASLPQTVTLDYGIGVAHRATGYRIGRGSTNATAPATWRVEGSNDADAWIVLDERSCSWVGAPQNVTIDRFTNRRTEAGEHYRFFRIVVLAAETGAAPAIGELSLLEDDASAGVTWFTLSAIPGDITAEVQGNQTGLVGIYNAGDHIALNSTQNYTLIMHPGLSQRAFGLTGELERWLQWSETNFIGLVALAIVIAWIRKR